VSLPCAEAISPASPSLPSPESEYESKPLLVRSRSM
jgi:hypothetical protein